MSDAHPNDLIEQIIDALELPRDHDPASQREAEQLLHHDGIDDTALTDLTMLPFVTIDNADSRDLDQALLIESTDTGQRVRYALADASFYVRPGSALFAEAMARGTSYYTPVSALPMLPVTLSEGLVSLNPQVDRRALVFDMQLADDGQVLGTRILRARIRSRAKLSYERVQAFYDAQDSAKPHALADSDFAESLRQLRVFGERRMQLSRSRDVIEFDRRETEILVIDRQFEIRERTRYRSEKYNEQLSLLVNMEGAALLVSLTGRQQQLQAVFRVHAAPLKRELDTLRTTIDALVDTLGLPDDWRWTPPQSLADYLAALPADAAHRRRVAAIQRQVMMAQRASTYASEPGRHHALGAASYARFSSPMREVVGIFTHKELLEALTEAHDLQHDRASSDGEAEAPDHASDDVLRDAVIASGNLARQRQRQLDKRIEFDVIRRVLDREIESGEAGRYRGTVVGLRSDRLYVAVDRLAIDLKVYRQDMNTQYATTFTIDAIAARPVSGDAPVFHLGDAVELVATAFDRSRQRFVMALYAI